ncbi:MOSC domain-containing protein [Trinickia violacea]|uniref:MOSC domain-containing protein n=1 Tax=Trinickia violacea TaxID=2571746 RepID=A0A4P8IVS3_9BURK|nr:MOSC N-terminal beta barrel domain-containing protein [Trinickia violacea]QCP53272.1 MOSC domain-containing protein [Trinickia violacea]
MPAISQLIVYPIKSCAGIAFDTVRLLPYGLEYDRNWMLVDAAGRFITQRTFPRLALVKVEIGASELIVSAPGMDALRTPLSADDLQGAPVVKATVWRDTVAAFDTGPDTARWFSAFLGTPVRLVRFDPSALRLAIRTWTGDIDVPTRFADGYPLLVISQASLDDLNERLTRKGATAIPMNRFRPNIVVTGLEAYEEDYVETLRCEGGDAIELRVVKPCARCPMPTIDQATGAPDPQWPNEPTDTMSAYRANSRLDGALTFGQNAIVIAGAGAHLAVGQSLDAELGFGD